MKRVRALYVIAVLWALAVPAYGQGPALRMLDQLEPGTWELRERGDSGSVQNLCLENGHRLIQLRHPGLPCPSVVVGDSADDVTVQYTCKGRGFGRTHIRRESNGLVQIDSQGIVNGLPFSFSAEGRRIGKCHS